MNIMLKPVAAAAMFLALPATANAFPALSDPTHIKGTPSVTGQTALTTAETGVIRAGYKRRGYRSHRGRRGFGRHRSLRGGVYNRPYYGGNRSYNRYYRRGYRSRSYYGGYRRYHRGFYGHGYRSYGGYFGRYGRAGRYRW